jgi:hypothetical protein
MGYKPRDKTLLDEAKERAFDVLKKTLDTSQVYVIDSSMSGAIGPLSPASARKSIEALTLHPVSRPLNLAVASAYAAIADSDRPRHEVYVLTDLARSAWDLNRPLKPADKAAQAKAAKGKTPVKTYVLRMTPPDVRDVAVVEARPSSEVVTEGQPVEIVAKIRSLGPETTRVAELRLDGVPRGKKQVTIPANGEVEVRFPVQQVGASVPLHQGQVSVSGEADPVAFDDVRYFTFTLKPPANVLVVSDEPIDGQFIGDAIDPDIKALPPGAPRPFRAERILSSELADRTADQLRRYRCVFLNNVARLTETEWGRLGAYVLDGGGLVVGLGRATDRDSFSGSAASQILPATLENDDPPKRPTTFGQIPDETHPLFSRYARELEPVLSRIPVQRYWGVKAHEGSSSRVLLYYADNAPALVERVFKGSRTGRALLWTTPLSRRAALDSPDAWSELANPKYWPFYYLMNQTVTYLSGMAGETHDFEAGKDVVLPLDPSRRYKSYFVQAPVKGVGEQVSPAEGSDSLVVVSPQHLGNWSVKATGTEGSMGLTGFSVNSPLAETQFAPLEEAELVSLFGGKDQFALANDPESLERVVQTTRVGREMFPWLILVIMAVVTAEGILANRFYRESGSRAAVSQA